MDKIKIILSYISKGLGYIAIWLGFFSVRVSILFPYLLQQQGILVNVAPFLVIAFIFIPLGNMIKKEQRGTHIIKDFSIATLISLSKEVYFLMTVSFGYLKPLAILPLILMAASGIVLILSLKKLGIIKDNTEVKEEQEEVIYNEEP